jgi:signal transduction histidine kinase/CheY-like chemotaxis protein
LTRTSEPPSRDSFRVLVLTPHGRDGSIASRVLADSSIESHVCSDVEELSAAINTGAGAILLAVEALTPPGLRTLIECLERQPSWSEIPLLVLAPAAAEGRTAVPAPLEERAHVTVLDRPLHTKTLISAVRSALRSRRRQYQLRDLMEALESRVNERDRFLAILGHELRNPLGAILLAAQTAEEGSGRIEREHAEIIDRQARHLTHLVDDLLDLSRITAGKIVLQKVPIDLAEAVEHSLRSVIENNPYRRNGVEIRKKLEPVVVEADPVRLEQIISNLLTNAIKYTPKGGWVEIVSRTSRGRAELCITDSGVGIAPDRLETIFGIFAQAENSIGRTQGGMGIGLSLVKNLVELHHGRVSASSDGVGKGAEFVVQFPLATQGGVQSHPSPRPHQRENTASLDIVIVEDNADVRMLLQIRLQKMGHQVTACATGEDGVQEIVNSRPDLAIIDIGLPGIDGYEVARQIRTSSGSGIFLLALSGFGQPEDKRRAKEAGFDDHVTKPIEARDLESVLASVAAAIDGGEEEPDQQDAQHAS